MSRLRSWCNCWHCIGEIDEMKVRDAAARLEVSPATIYALIAAGRLKCCRIGVGRGDESGH